MSRPEPPGASGANAPPRAGASGAHAPPPSGASGAPPPPGASSAAPPPGASGAMRFAEELLLLLFEDGAGDLSGQLAPRRLHLLLAGSVLMDLALEGRIDTDLTRLMLVDPTPLGDDLLDPSLADIAQAEAGRDAAYWVERHAPRGEEIREAALARLAARGILEPDAAGGGFSLSRRVSLARQYTAAADGPAREEVRLRLMRVLFSDDIPDPRDTVIICLADAAGVFDRILTRSEQFEARERIDLVKRLDLVGQAVTEAVRAADPDAAAAVCRPASEIPCAPGLPLVGNAFALAADAGGFLLRQYRRLGPVFRVRAFRRGFIVLVGPEANRFLAGGGACFRTHEIFAGFNAALGTWQQLMSMGGPDHARMRKRQAPGYSRTAIRGRVGEAMDIVRRDIAEWPTEQPIPVQYACQRIIVEQLGRLAAGRSARPYLDDILVFVDALLSVHLVRSRPRLTMRRPRVRRAQQRMLALAEQVLADHDPARRRGQEPDFIDEVLALHRSDPELLPETDLPAAALSPFITGVETAATVCACMLYELLSRPDLRDRVTAEADALLGGGAPPTLSDLRAFDVTHRVAMEAMRLYPFTPATPRLVANSFEFQGYRVPAGEQLLVGITLTHHLAECFPDPERFDIERYAPGRDEHRQPGAYAPFSIGAHNCLGRGLAEALIVLTVATMLHEAELALDPPGYVLRRKQLPTVHPDASFRMRLRRRRQPGSG